MGPLRINSDDRRLGAPEGRPRICRSVPRDEASFRHGLLHANVFSIRFLGADELDLRAVALRELEEPRRRGEGRLAVFSRLRFRDQPVRGGGGALEFLALLLLVLGLAAARCREGTVHNLGLRVRLWSVRTRLDFRGGSLRRLLGGRNAAL